MSDLSHNPSQPGIFARVFTAHPASVNETYWGHMAFALGFAFWLLVAGFAALAHALIPACCETTASRILKRLHAKIEARH